TFNEPSQAEPLKQKLEKTGIYAEVCDESKYEWFWFVTKPIAGIRLKVHKKDFEKARQYLREWDGAEGVLRDAVRCPQCGDSRIEAQPADSGGTLAVPPPQFEVHGLKVCEQP